MAPLSSLEAEIVSVGMDVIREDLVAARRRRRATVAVLASFLAGATVYGLARLEPAAPVVDRSMVWTGNVTRGTMIRQVRGAGNLVPETVQWITASSSGRVEGVHVAPGARVDAETVLIDLTDPQLSQAAAEAQWRLRAAEAEYEGLRGRLAGQLLEQEALIASLEAEAVQARLRADADNQLAAQGLLAELPRRLSESHAVELARRVELETRRLAALSESASAQLNAQRANAEQARSVAELQVQREQSLAVKAGIDGVLQQVSVEIGQRVSSGSTLAKVSQPERLKAELRVAETQARDIQLGQRAMIDTRNGTVAGTVVRIDPASRGGTVTVDIRIDEPLPRGARPDLSVDGTIELERLVNVLHLDRPVHAADHSTIGLFRLDREGNGVRVPVRIGRTSVNRVEILGGLEEGDEVILSDTSAWDDIERIRVR